MGGVELPRPEWLPVEAAEAENRWNDFLADQAASALDETGLSSTASDTALGATAGDEPAPMPSEWEQFTEVLTDPALPDLAASVSEPVAAAGAEIAPQIAQSVESVLVQSGLPLG